MSSREGDSVRYVGGTPLPAMSQAIAELRKQGFAALADELTHIKEAWARRVMHYAQARDAAAHQQPLKPPVPMRVPRPQLRVVTLERDAQKPASPARAHVEIPRRPQGDRA